MSLHFADRSHWNIRIRSCLWLYASAEPCPRVLGASLGYKNNSFSSAIVFAYFILPSTKINKWRDDSYLTGIDPL
jgi:hypothetical protein